MDHLRWVLIAAVALTAAACADLSAGERQWYKPSGNYTSAEFERDRRECTRDRQLDEGCMRQRGWTSLSADVGPVQKQPPTPRPSRY
jgi:hypothetical protein